MKRNKNVNNNNNNCTLDNFISRDSKKVYSKQTFIYGWGRNDNGELGLGSNQNIMIPTPIKSLKNKIIIAVCSGGKNSMLLSNEGKVYICGSRMFGMLGSNNVQTITKKFQLLSEIDGENEFISEIACAEFHSLCLNDKGHIFAWGGNLYNKLGQQQLSLMGKPFKISSLITKKIISISCGDHHSCALSNTGEIFTWGGGGKSYNRGQCGHGDLKDVDNPKRVEFFNNKKVTKISCGGYHTVVLCEDGKVFGFGKGEFGQCGYGESRDTSTPQLVRFNLRMIELYENPSSTTTNNMYNNNNEGFEPFTTLKNPNLQVKTTTELHIVDIKCGGEHSLILSQSGRVYAFGHGYHGQLGLGNNRNCTVPIIVKALTNKKVVQIAAGWSHSMVLTSEGNLYVSGCGKYGELGLEGDGKVNKCNFTLLRCASELNISRIYAGGHHSWLITDNNVPERIGFQMPEPLRPSNYRVKRNRNSNGTNKSFSMKSEHIKDINSFHEESDIDFETSNNDNIRNIDMSNKRNESEGYKSDFSIKNEKQEQMDVDDIAKYLQVSDDQKSMNSNEFNQMYKNANEQEEEGNENEEEEEDNENEQNENEENEEEDDNENEEKEEDENEEVEDNENEENKDNGNDNENEEENMSIQNQNKTNSISSNNINDYITKKRPPNKHLSTFVNYEMLLNNLSKISNDKLQLQIIYTDLKHSHRFVYFEIPKENKYFNTPLKDIDSLFQTYFSKDKANITYRLEDDRTMYKSLSNPNQQTISIIKILYKELLNFQILINDETNIRQFSLAIVYDYSLNPKIKQLQNTIIQTKEIEQTKPPYEIVLLNEEDIHTNTTENILSNWMYDMYNHFIDFFTNHNSNKHVNENELILPKFLEMRPNCFAAKYISD